MRASGWVMYTTGGGDSDQLSFVTFADPVFFPLPFKFPFDCFHLVLFLLHLLPWPNNGPQCGRVSCNLSTLVLQYPLSQDLRKIASTLSFDSISGHSPGHV